MSALRRFRDSFVDYVPWWMRDRPEFQAAYKFLWAMIAPLDVLLDVRLRGIAAAYPGIGTPTALPYIGQARGIVRGRGESDESYAQRLREWLDRWRTAGSAYALARELRDYLQDGGYRVRVITRGGVMVTVEADGTLETTKTTYWDWDSISNPERAGFWSDLWVIVYGMPWPVTTYATVSKEHGLGHLVPLPEADAVKGIISQWKSAHSRVRCVIWTDDPSFCDPDDPETWPGGTWGRWSRNNAGDQVRTRDLDKRYWEP
jgi:hypothetical protein